MASHEDNLEESVNRLAKYIVDLNNMGKVHEVKMTAKYHLVNIIAEAVKITELAKLMLERRNNG